MDGFSNAPHFKDVSEGSIDTVLLNIKFSSIYKRNPNFFATAISGNKRVADGGGDIGIPVEAALLVLNIFLYEFNLWGSLFFFCFSF